jgi:DNA-directed RNA polymerase subunit H (RpoH/RPB5)
MASDKYLVIKNTCIEMMEDRCYTVIDSDDDNILFENMSNGDRILSCIFDEPKLNVNNVKDMILILNENDLKHGIIIYNEVITSTAKKIIDTLQDYFIETFSMDELKYNITKHRLVPKHVKANEEEYKELKKFGPKLPVMLKTDPVTRYYNYKSGDIIRVERFDGNIIYRIVR